MALPWFRKRSLGVCMKSGTSTITNLLIRRPGCVYIRCHLRPGQPVSSTWQTVKNEPVSNLHYIYRYRRYMAFPILRVTLHYNASCGRSSNLRLFGADRLRLIYIMPHKRAKRVPREQNKMDASVSFEETLPPDLTVNCPQLLAG